MWRFSYSRGLMISQLEVGGLVEGAGEGGGLALVHPHVLLEAEAFAIGEEQGLGEQQGSAGHDGRVLRAGHLVFEDVHDFGILDQAFAHRLEDVVHHDGRGLAFGDGVAGGVHLVFGEVVGVAGRVGGDVVGGLVVPFFEVGVLVLEGVGELVGEDRLLLVDVDPVEHVDGLGFGVVVGFDLLLEQGEQKGLEVEVAVEQAELLEHDFVALEAFGVLVVVEFFLEVALDGGAGGELALDRALDGQPGFIGGELDELVDQRKELLGLLGGDVGRAHLACRGRAGLVAAPAARLALRASRRAATDTRQNAARQSRTWCRIRSVGLARGGRCLLPDFDLPSRLPLLLLPAAARFAWLRIVPGYRGIPAGAGLSTSKAIIRMRSGAKSDRKNCTGRRKSSPMTETEPIPNDTDNGAGCAA